MSLYGALFAGVGGLKAQGTKIGIISDNIANVNTVGYKATKAAFETLVVNSSSNVSYSPGGVVANNVQKVDSQGILTATDAPTDIAMSGAGFFVVNAQSNGSGEPLYTRAGSFRQDELGNFVNTAGFYLQGWPLDREGRLPGEVGNLNTTSFANLDSLETVNVETQSGVASGTTLVEIGANLDAEEGIYPGSGVTSNLSASAGTSIENAGIAAADLLVYDTAAAAGTIQPQTPDGVTNGDTISVQTQNGSVQTFEYGGITATNNVTTAPNTPPFLGNIFDATNTSDTFFGSTPLTNYTTAARSFSITTATGGTQTFTYVESSPSALSGEFNNMINLAAAINQADGLTARVVNNQLYVGPENANEAMTFANVDDAGATGIDWISEVGFVDVTATDNNRFNSLQGLSDLINSIGVGISAQINSPISESSIQIYTDDPTEEISFYDGPDNDPNATVSPAGGSLLAEFGLAGNADFVPAGFDAAGNPDASVENRITGIASAYDPTGSSGMNMASGDIVAHFSRNVRVYDALGGGHDLRMSFLKIGGNEWAVEIHAIPADGIVQSSSSNLVDGQVATGQVVFNGDGTLNFVSPSLLNEVPITWNPDDPITSQVAFNFGTAGELFEDAQDGDVIGLTDGLSQFSSDYNVAFVEQNGAPVGELIGVTINDAGEVIASYSNGETQALYKLPIADFNNPNGLQAETGNVYSQTQASGEVNLREAGSNGTGTVVSAALESSNVELAEELTDMIVAQRAYQASSKVISTTDELLEELTRL